MKEWLTAREIAAEALPDMPATKQGVNAMIARDGWTGRQRSGRDGGGGTEYHFGLLPVLAQVAYSQKYMVVDLPAPPAGPGSDTPDSGLSARAQKERDARLAIAAAFNRFSKGLHLGHATLIQIYTDKFNAGSIAVEPWVREIVPTLSKRSLIRWNSAKRDGKINALGHDPAQARKGTGVLETANGGRVRAFLLGLLAQQSHLSAHHLRTLCRSEFGDTVTVISKGVETAMPMPPVRTFQHALKSLKASHKVQLTKLTNPDLYRSTLAPSGIGMLRHVNEPNQLWQIDASPVDALCVDGRHAVYVCIDIATRRQIFSLSRTPRASAVALLIRKAILAWGVPDGIKTDNGSDFTAHDTQRLFAALGIEIELCEAYSPEQKGHVERAIGTFQREIGPLLPGFIGHSVADRKAIENRKSFAHRLGETEAETFRVSLTSAQLQAHIDDWSTLVQQHKPHAGLKNLTPANAALASSRPMRSVDARALDLLLMPVAGSDGQRVVTKLGIRIDGRYYMTPSILPGTPVFVRQDPVDLGRAYAFAQDGAEFLGEATCPELSGIHPETFVREAKALQKEMLDAAVGPIRAEARRIAKGPALIQRVLDVARQDAPNVIPLPRREEPHFTPQIAAAIEAMGETVHPTRPLDARAAAAHRRLIEEMRLADEQALNQRTEEIYERRAAEIEAARTAHIPEGANVVALPETPKERYRRALIIRRAGEAGKPVVHADAVWLGRYETSAEYRAQARMHEDFGDAYLS